MTNCNKPSLPAYTFANLRFKHGTGRAFTISGSGRDRKIGYRAGVATEIGDIEKSEWKKLMFDLIQRSGENSLYQALVEWHTSTPFLKTKQEVEYYALQLHSLRIFDDPMWCDYIPFNLKYRPDAVDNSSLVRVLPECCKTPGLVTKERLSKPQFSLDGPTVPCPHCGRATIYSVLSDEM